MRGETGGQVEEEIAGWAEKHMAVWASITSIPSMERLRPH
jgi:hypothetical protein